MMRDLAATRDGLDIRLAELEAQIERIEREQRTPLDDDMDEQAIERETRDALDAEQRGAVAELKAVRDALARLDAGRYGICTRCGIPIDAARLEALPAAAHCIECERELGG